MEQKPGPAIEQRGPVHSTSFILTAEAKAAITVTIAIFRMLVQQQSPLCEKAISSYKWQRVQRISSAMMIIKCNQNTG